MHSDLVNQTVELIRRCSTDLPGDVESALSRARDREDEDTMARAVLDSLMENVELAREKSVPMCQDTGAPAFWVNLPLGQSMAVIEQQLTQAVKEATKVSYLRPNAVDPVSGLNSGDNTGTHAPIFHWKEHHGPLEVTLLLKGGGSENVSVQYKLPDAGLGAGRDLEGVRRCVIDAVYHAQGKGCAPGILGVGIGGNRDTSYQVAKEALLRKLDVPNEDSDLERLEKTLFRELNSLGIGPMGFGGRTTVMGVNCAAAHRLPACYFVSVAYTCWACRRRSMTVDGGEVHYD